jgi:hypothetical protein
MSREDAEGISLQKIADTLLEPLSRVKRALAAFEAAGLALRECDGRERMYEVRSVIPFMAFYRLWEHRQRIEKQANQRKRQEKLYATDPRALLRRAQTELAKARADIASASKAMRLEGLVTIQFLTDERLKPREPFKVTVAVRGLQGKSIVAELPELALSVTGRARAAVLDRLRTEIVELYWRLRDQPEAEPARWATLQQMIEERPGSEGVQP